MKQPQQPSRYRRIALISAGVAIVVVAGGSLVYWAPTLFSANGTLGSLATSLAHLGGARLSVKIDHNTIPADGFSQTKITIVTSRIIEPATVSLLSGDGKLDPLPKNPGREFVYTAGQQPGPVEIKVIVGSLSDTIKFTQVEGVTPKHPILVAPPDGSTTNDPKPEVAGTAPPNTNLVITTDGAENTLTHSDEQGIFKTILKKPLINGQHSISVSVIDELGKASLTSNVITFTIKSDPVNVDSGNIRTTPQQIIAQSSFGLFVPATLNTERVVVELQDRTFELHDAHGSSIFSANLPAPEEAGVYFGNLILYDIGNNPTRFEKLLRFSVISP